MAANLFSLDNIIMLAGTAVFVAFLWGLYAFMFKPKYMAPGIYKNPKVGRRKLPTVVTPDTIGTLIGFIDEEGETELGAEYCTLILEADGQEIIIPHVNVNRDLKPFNNKQAYAGADAPVLICAVDRNGLRNPGALDSLKTGNNIIKDLDQENLEKERRRLMTEFARVKQNLRNTSSDEYLYDKFEDWADRTGRIRQAVNRFNMNEDGENEEGKDEKGRS
jgi:hypothetical protein